MLQKLLDMNTDALASQPFAVAVGCPFPPGIPHSRPRMSPRRPEDSLHTHVALRMQKSLSGKVPDIPDGDEVHGLDGNVTLQDSCDEAAGCIVGE